MSKLRMAACASGLALAIGAPAAVAAGSGYGGGSGHQGGSPGGFGSVSQVGSVNGKKGGKTGRYPYKITVPKGSAKGTLQIVIYKGSAATVLKDLEGSLKHDKVLESFGFGLFSGSKAIQSKKFLTLENYLKGLGKGDILVAYNPRTGKFTPIGGATFSHGKLTFKLKAGGDYAVLAHH